ncbi:hypothetical protein HID58_086677, partial [Brassica napus]
CIIYVSTYDLFELKVIRRSWTEEHGAWLDQVRLRLSYRELLIGDVVLGELIAQSSRNMVTVTSRIRYGRTHLLRLMVIIRLMGTIALLVTSVEQLHSPR